MPRLKKIPTAVQKALASGARLPQMAELLDHFLAGAGGPEGVAQMLLAEYRSARPGTIIRQRILDSVLRMIATANQQLSPPEQLDLVDQKDIERELGTLIHQMPDEDAAEEETARPAAGAVAPGGPVGPG